MTQDITQDALRTTVSTLTSALSGQALDASLERWLNEAHGPASATYEALRAACVAGVREGWLCTREGGGIRYGRVFKPGPELHGFSLDVVDMCDVAHVDHVQREPVQFRAGLEHPAVADAAALARAEPPLAHARDAGGTQGFVGCGGGPVSLVKPALERRVQRLARKGRGQCRDGGAQCVLSDVLGHGRACGQSRSSSIVSCTKMQAL